MSRPLEKMFDRIETRIARYPKAATFGLAEAGHDSLYEQLVSCVLSIRTLDETSYPASLRLFARARTPEALLALGVPAISVDVHVHRVANRWGLVDTKEPKATLRALEPLVPRARWIDVNRLLMPFGKHVCTGPRPRCEACPVREWCDHGRGESDRDGAVG